MSRFPDGWFAGDVICFGRRPEAGVRAARGASVLLEDLRQAEAGLQEQRYAGLRAFLCSLMPGEVLQIQWSRSGDYAESLRRYRRITESSGASGWCRWVREERESRYLKLLREGNLRREQVEVWLSQPVGPVSSLQAGAAAEFEGRMGQVAENLGRRFADLQTALPGSRVMPMDASGHFRSWLGFLQPSLGIDARLSALVRPELSLLDNTLGSDLSFGEEPGTPVMRMDGHFQSIIVLRQWPQQTWSGVLWPLLDCSAPNLRITLVVRAANLESLVRREEDDIRRLEGQAQSERKPSLQAIAARKRQRVADLQSGAIRPFLAVFVARIWDRTLEGLALQASAVRTAIAGLAGARHHQADHPVQARNLFLETLPGWSGSYRAWDRHADSNFLPDLMPMSSSFDGDLEEGHAIYDGERGTLVGISGFPGGEPAHGVVLGMTRAGKSSFVIDYVSQTHCVTDYRVIVDDGFSYGEAARLLGAEPLVLQTDGRQTLNPFDTQGLPMTAAQAGGIAALLLLLAGGAADSDVAARRRAILVETLHQLLDDTWQDYQRKRPADAAIIRRLSLHLERSYGSSASLVEALASHRSDEAADPSRVCDILEGYTEEEVLLHVGSPGGRSRIRNLACAFYQASEMPRLAGFWELLRFDPPPQQDRSELEFLAAMLGPWTSTGPNGPLFDGASTVRLDGRLVHVELGKLPSSARQLKAAALFQIFNQVRQRVTQLPRAQRKELILEEPARYIGDAGVEDVIEEGYAQMGKYGCRILPVTQQYAQLARSRVRPIVFGNASRIWLMRQNDRRDLEDLSRDIDVPVPLREAVLRFPRPVDQPEDRRFASVALIQKGEGAAVGGVLRHVASKEMQAIAESSGAGFDQRTQTGAALRARLFPDGEGRMAA